MASELGGLSTFLRCGNRSLSESSSARHLRGLFGGPDHRLRPIQLSVWSSGHLWGRFDPGLPPGLGMPSPGSYMPWGSYSASLNSSGIVWSDYLASTCPSPAVGSFWFSIKHESASALHLIFCTISVNSSFKMQAMSRGAVFCLADHPLILQSYSLVHLVLQGVSRVGPLSAPSVISYIVWQVPGSSGSGRRRGVFTLAESLKVTLSK